MRTENCKMQNANCKLQIANLQCSFCNLQWSGSASRIGESSIPAATNPEILPQDLPFPTFPKSRQDFMRFSDRKPGSPIWQLPHAD